MRKYNEIRDTFPVVPYPGKTTFTTLYGYAAGKALGAFTSGSDAKAAGATVTDQVFDKIGWNAAFKKYQDNQQAISAAWDAELRADYPPMSDDMYSAIYSLAHDRGHSSGPDEVAIYFDEYYDFAMKVIDINKKDTNV